MMDADKFLGDFFGTGNGIVWGQMPTDLEDWLQPWIERVRHLRYPIFLPRFTPERRMVWYAAAGSAPSGAELSELIAAFVGHSYADFSGRITPLRPDDPVDQAVANYLGTVVYQFTIPNREDAAAVRAALDRLRYLLDSRPVDSRRLSRPAGRILRDFEFALVSGDDRLSKQLIDELRTNGHLNAANISFLEVARLADLGDWEGVLSHPSVPRLVEMRRPIRVTHSLVEAVYRRHFLESDRARDTAEAVKAMRETVLPKFGTLYQGASASGKYAVPSLLLVCLATNGPPPAGSSQLLSLAEAQDDSFTTALAAELRRKLGPGSKAAEDPLAVARSAIAEGQAQLVVGLLADAAESPERAVLLLQCAYELNALAYANIAVAALDGLSTASRASLPQSRNFRDLVAYVQGLVGGNAGSSHSPSSWTEWFGRVASDPGSHSNALRWAQLGADEWGTDEFKDEAALRIMTTSLGTGTDEVVAIHRDALPYFLRGFAHLEVASVRPLKRQVLDTLLYRGAHSRAELDILLDVLEMTVPDMDPISYGQVLQDFTEVWLAVQSPASLEWAIQALDILAQQPCRDTSARSGFALAVFATANSHLRRIQLPLRLTLNDIGRDLDVPLEMLLRQEAAETVRADPLEALRGQRLALYTLTESAGLRARDLLAGWTKVRVDLFSDKVCSDALRIAARESDIFVMVTRSAKHAATDCIKANRPDRKPLVTTSGKGTSSIMYAVRQFLTEGEDVAA